MALGEADACALREDVWAFFGWDARADAARVGVRAA
jgi:hypothetical protein